MASGQTGTAALVFNGQRIAQRPRHARTEEDPGDVTQAVRIYERMKRSYEILMDPTLRKAHDERMTANVRTAGGESPPEHGV